MFRHFLFVYAALAFIAIQGNAAPAPPERTDKEEIDFDYCAAIKIKLDRVKLTRDGITLGSVCDRIDNFIDSHESYTTTELGLLEICKKADGKAPCLLKDYATFEITLKKATKKK